MQSCTRAFGLNFCGLGWNFRKHVQNQSTQRRPAPLQRWPLNCWKLPAFQMWRQHIESQCFQNMVLWQGLKNHNLSTVQEPQLSLHVPTKYKHKNRYINESKFSTVFLVAFEQIHFLLVGLHGSDRSGFAHQFVNQQERSRRNGEVKADSLQSKSLVSSLKTLQKLKVSWKFQNLQKVLMIQKNSNLISDTRKNTLESYVGHFK